MNRKEAVKMIIDAYRLLNNEPDRLDDLWYELHIEFKLDSVSTKNHVAIYDMTMKDEESFEGVVVKFDYEKAGEEYLFQYYCLMTLPIDSFSIQQWDGSNNIVHKHYDVAE